MNESTNTIGSLDKGIQVLEVLCQADRDLGVSEVSRQLGINKTTIFRILQTLMTRGLVEQCGETDRYRPAMRLLFLSNQVLNRMEIRRMAWDHLQQLSRQVGESIHLALNDGDEIVIVDKVENHDAQSIRFHPGRRSPLYCTSLGKVFLADWSPEKLDAYCNRANFIQHTPTTRATTETLVQDLGEIKKCHYGLDREEHHIGIFCIAAPIRDYTGKVAAAISITGPTFRVAEQYPKFVTPLLHAAQEISKRLGHGR